MIKCFFYTFIALFMATIKLLTLVDFSEGSAQVLRKVALMATSKDAQVYALHVVKTAEEVATSAVKLEQFCNENSDFQIQTTVLCGDLFDCVKSYAIQLQPSLVLIKTHGIRGVSQHLFGSLIFKLVQNIPFPCLVYPGERIESGFNIRKILFPLGQHSMFKVKISQTAAIAKLFEAQITLYHIEADLSGSEVSMAVQVAESSEYFESHGISVQKQTDPIRFFSAGYAKQTLHYAQTQGYDVISIVATPEGQQTANPVLDKEMFLCNEAGIPILACNNY